MPPFTPINMTRTTPAGSTPASDNDELFKNVKLEVSDDIVMDDIKKGREDNVGNGQEVRMHMYYVYIS